MEDYNEVTDNGVKVFMPKDANTAPGGVKISMTGEGPWKGLSIQGLMQ